MWLWLNTNILGENVGLSYVVRSELKVYLEQGELITVGEFGYCTETWLYFLL